MFKKGDKLTENHKKKISEALKGKPKSEEHKKRLKENHKGTTGKHWISKMKGKKRPLFSEEWKTRISNALKGKSYHTKEWKKKLSDNWKKNKNPNWQGGKSFEPYGLEFNDDLKEVIRNRDRRKCIECEMIEFENKERLTIHHIDGNKENNNPNNLISLCRKCHAKTNSNRGYWINYFKNKLL